MVFKPEEIKAFQALFNAHKEAIRKVEGCLRLELLQDVNSPEVFFTYSWWEDEKYLLEYKNSELFGVVWPATKALFAEKPEAWTSEQRHVLA